MEISLFIFTIFLSSLVHYGSQKLFIYFKRFDSFNNRSSHNTLATRTGGIGIFVTILLVSLFNYFNKIDLFDYSLFIPLGIMFIIGVYDDLYNADFKLKFFLQIIVAKILIDQGLVITNYHGLFGIYEVSWIFAQITTLFVFLVVVNAINFIDGIDGLAITEVIKIIFFIEFFSQGYSNLAPLGLIIIFTLMPLFYFNFKKKRKVFLGDGGSMLLGTIVMIYVLHVLGENYLFKTGFIFNKTLFVILILTYPLFDLLRVFVLRIKDGLSPFVADQRHIHHIILKKFNNHFICLLTILFFELIFITTLLNF